MERKKRKILIYVIVALGLVVFTSRMFLPDGNFRFMETSLLTIMQNIAEENKPEPPNLAIEKVSLRKVGNPGSNFNYYRYKATVVIKNHGGGVRDAQLVLGGAGQKSVFINNVETGLTLRRDQIYILEGYDLIFDGDYNGGEIELKIELKNAPDYYQDNNYYNVRVFELPPKIETFAIDGIRDDVGFVTEFSAKDDGLSAADYYVVTSDILKSIDGDARYDELMADEKVYSYHRIKNSEEIAWADGWKEQKIPSRSGHFLKFASDPFQDKSAHFAYIRAVNPVNGSFAVSNILKFDEQRELTRAEFAKLFADYTDMELDSDGLMFYQDVPKDAWYAPYVQTLYNAGLLKDGSYKYHPDKVMKRGEVLRVVLDYFDADLALGSGLQPFFADVSEKHYLYPYLQALKAAGIGRVFDEQFGIDLPATKNFLKYLVDEYNENS